MTGRTSLAWLVLGVALVALVGLSVSAGQGDVQEPSRTQAGDGTRGTTGADPAATFDPVTTGAQGAGAQEALPTGPDARAMEPRDRRVAGGPAHPAAAPSLPALEDSGWVLVDADSFLAYLPVATACAVRFDPAGESLEVIVPSLGLTSLALQAIGYAPRWLGMDLADIFRRLSATYQDQYAAIILGTADPIVDEVAFVIAHTAPEVLQSPSFNSALVTENAEGIYANDAFLDYVEIVDYGSAAAGGDYYSTASYRTVEAGDTIEVVLPRERYYWDIVHLKITDEMPAYINPATGSITAPPVGKFWRGFLFSYADSTYPVLRDELAGCQVLWEGNVDSITNGAIGIITQWILDVMDFGSGAERPIQPVRIYRLHLGRCGEHADITAAAARAALIPTNSASSYDNDHTWNEFWDRRWIAWEPVNVYVDAPWHYEGWGMQFIGVFDWRGDDGVWTVTERYTPYCTFTAVVTDAAGYPVDGAQVAIARKTGTVTYPISTWGSTGSDGRCTFLLGDNQDIYARIESDLGTVPPGGLYKLAVAGSVAGQEYVWEKSLTGTRARLPMLAAPPPAETLGDYRLRLAWEVENEYAYGRNRMDNNTASDNLAGGAAASFVCDAANYGAYAAADTFWAHDIAEDVGSRATAFTLPADETYYAVVSNQQHVVKSEVVRGRAELYRRAGAGVAVGTGGTGRGPELSLGAGHPTPAAGETWISYTLPVAAVIDLAVFDVAGRRVATLVSGRVDAGEHRVAWNGCGTGGHPVAPGVYLSQLATPRGSLSRKLVVIR